MAERERNYLPRGVAVATGCPVSCPAHLLREGVGTSLDFRTTRSSLCPCSPCLPFPLPPPSLSSSGFVIVPPTFSSIKEIRDYNLHLRFQAVLDSHPFDWWSFLLSSSSNVLFPVKFLSSGSISTLSVGVIFIMSSDRQTKQGRKGMPSSGPRYVFERLPPLRFLLSGELPLISM